MLQATFTDFRKHAKAYFDAVEKGETVRIIRHGKVIAEVNPADHAKKLSWQNPGLKLNAKGASLTKSILQERKSSR